jgi:hypothetical protein
MWMAVTGPPRSLTLPQISRLAYSRSANSLTAKRPVRRWIPLLRLHVIFLTVSAFHPLCMRLTEHQTDPIDGPPFVVGIVTLLRQFHASHTHRSALIYSPTRR